MTKEFKNANEFITVHRRCLMCGELLSPAIKNLTTLSGGKPYIKSNYVSNSFNFDIEYNSSTISVDCSVVIDCKTDLVNFINKECWLIDPQKNDITRFGMLDLYIENGCTNPSCKYDYYISSDMLKLEENGHSCKLKPVRLYFESFSVGKIKVLNDHLHGVTNIFSNKKYNAPPIEVAILDFKGLDPDKIINKIKTVVNFS